MLRVANPLMNPLKQSGWIMFVVLLWSFHPAAVAQAPKDLNLETGEQIFQATCAGCHGPDGKGQPQHILGFDPPATFPDFTDCNGSTREARLQWSAVIHQGGGARAFTEIMPSFGPPKDALLTDQEIDKIITYLKGFCAEDAKWPAGEFNFARPMFTEKSFPEDETILTTTFNAEGAPGVMHDLIMEKRIGTTGNVSAHFRGGFTQLPSGSWAGAVGDTSFEYKQALFLRNKSGTMLVAGGEFTVPTGNPKLDLGGGLTKGEAFLALAQILPKRAYVQTQVGMEAPLFHRHQSAAELFGRAAIGKSFNFGHGFGREISIAHEFIAVRALEPRPSWTLDVVPQMQVTLSKRQHIRLGIGVNVPAMNVGNRQTQVMMYVLWDRFDGGMTEGWR
ncbi:MAG: cytochrome c [Acidobacteriota bacterium]